MDYKELYELWLTNPYFDEDTRKELEAIKDDNKEIEDRFYKDLEFGTAGLRGVIGAGSFFWIRREENKRIADGISGR